MNETNLVYSASSRNPSARPESLRFRHVNCIIVMLEAGVFVQPGGRQNPRTQPRTATFHLQHAPFRRTASALVLAPARTRNQTLRRIIDFVGDSRSSQPRVPWREPHRKTVGPRDFPIICTSQQRKLPFRLRFRLLSLSAHDRATKLKLCRKQQEPMDASQPSSQLHRYTGAFVGRLAGWLAGATTPCCSH